MFNYEIKEKIVKRGDSRIFKDWKANSSITEDDFLAALKWVCEDPKNGGPHHNLLTREMGLSPDGIIKLDRRYLNDGYGLVLYKDGEFWGGETFMMPCPNPDYADASGMMKTIQKICLSAEDMV